MSKRDAMILSMMGMGIIGLMCFVVIRLDASDRRDLARKVECENKHGTYFWREEICLGVSTIPLESK